MAGINDYSNTAGSNTTINGIDIAEGCSPAGINNAIRQLMADIADMDDGVVPLQTPDINGGTIDGAIIGGTTPAAGTFTNLTATGTLTGLLGNVVEDVTPQLGGNLDLNSNDITGTGNINITGNITASGNLAGTLTTASQTNITSVGKLLIDVGNQTTIGLKANSGLNITSGGGLFNSIYQIGFGYETGTTYLPASIYALTTSSSGYNNNAICFATRDVTTDTAPLERMRIDSSGNVGIGTSSPSTKLTIEGAKGNIDVASNGILLIRDTTAYNSSPSAGIQFGVKYNTAGQVAVGSSIQGIKENATDGNFAQAMVFTTQGNAASPAEVMRLTSGGAVGIGTTSQISSAKLSVSGTIGSGALIINTGSASNVFTSYTNNGTSRFVVGLNATETGSNVGSDLYFNNFNDAGVQISTPMMIKRSSSNVGIGTISPASTTKLQVAGVIRSASADGTGMFNLGDATGPTHNVGIFRGTANSTSSGNWLNLGGYDGISFAVSNAALGSQTERMRIDSSGNVLVGRTDNPSGVSNCIYALGNYGITTGSGANVFINSEGLFFRSTSSLKYKNTIQDSTNGLTELLTLRPVTYKGNNDGNKIFGGLIAEEVHEAGLTEFVEYDDEGNPDALHYGNMVSLCIKAIQELKADNDALRTRIETLENA